MKTVITLRHKLLATHVQNVNVCQMIGIDKSSNFWLVDLLGC